MKRFVICLIAGLFLIFSAFPCLALTAEELMKGVVRNIQGPPGMAAVAGGKMKTSVEETDIRILHYVDSVKPAEVFQTEMYKIRGSGDANLKHKIMWKGEEGSTEMFIFSPAVRRERIIPAEILDGIEMSDYPFALLILYGILSEVKYISLEVRDGKSIVAAERKDGCSLPLLRATFTIDNYEGVPVIEKVEYFTEREETLIQFLEDYRRVEGAPEYIAPHKASVGKTTFSFNWWRIIKRPDWIFSHTNMGIQKIPKP